MENYLSFSKPVYGDESARVYEEILPGLHDTEEQFLRNSDIERKRKIISESNLSEMQSKVIKLFLEGYSQQEIARRSGYTLKSVDNALQSIKRKVRVKNEK